jgi:hypothetical protein
VTLIALGLAAALIVFVASGGHIRHILFLALLFLPLGLFSFPAAFSLRRDGNCTS